MTLVHHLKQMTHEERMHILLFVASLPNSLQTLDLRYWVIFFGALKDIYAALLKERLKNEETKPKGV